MSASRIIFDNVVQRFRVIRERPDTLREVFARVLHRRSQSIDFTALKRVSFHIGDGQSVGIIGRNGSGKSTLLKLIAGVYRPSSGTVTVSGRVGALIELAAGFHPDLTGRENIELNGLLLGISRKEIRRREAAIVEFAELGDFIDTPVKQYSSGMYMRLGFAIAAQLDADILLLDEILAVGDLAFQQKCLERIYELQANGKTIVLVSHDLNAIRQLCRRVLLIESGGIAADGGPSEVLPLYQTMMQQPSTVVDSM